MAVKRADRQAVREAGKTIRNGGLVAFPTETVYGLGADVYNPKAVAKIFEVKQRPCFDPLIVHIASLKDLPALSSCKNKAVNLLAKRFWPGPLTIVLPKQNVVPDIVTSGLQTVGIRMPDHEIALELIKASGCPIAAPSANKFGQISPTSAFHVEKQLPDIDCILDGGNTTVGIESTVIALNERGFKILRHGVITRRELEAVVPSLGDAPGLGNSAASPGMLQSHYSPIKPMYILGQPFSDSFKKEEAAFMSFSGQEVEGYKRVEILTRKADLKEYAVNLFAAMHRLEEADVQFIVAEPVPEHGIGLAIMDKLRKASFQYSTEQDKKGSIHERA